MDRLQRRRAQATGGHWLAASAGAALFALRVSLEATPQHPLWGAVAALLIALAGYGVRIAGAPLSLAPLCLLWLYVVWPAASPPMALGVGFVAGVASLVQNLRGRRCPVLLLDGALFLGALALYVATLAPTVLPADSGEFQIVGPLLGVAHPPGFALFTLLAKGFSLLPVGEIAWRLNLMGALSGALTLVVVARTARRIANGDPWAGIAAAGALGVSTTFWAQSTTINIRMLTMLFTALCCDYLVRFLSLPAASRQSVNALSGLALSFGLAIAHHAWPAFLAPLFGALILWHDPGLLKRVRLWPRYLLAFLAPFLSDLYIVVRAISGAPFGTEELVDAGRVIDHLLGRGFGGDMFAFLKLNRLLWERFQVMGNILHFQFGGPLLVLAGLGFAWLAWKRGRVAFLLGGIWVTMVFIVATYRAPQSVEYLMPAYIPVALCIGSSAVLAAQRTSGSRTLPTLYPATSPIRRSLHSLLVALLLLPILLMGWAHLPSYLALHDDRSAREYAESLLLDAPPNAHILSNWHWYTPLRYLQLVEGQRTDVQVTYLHPQGATPMPQAWPQRIARELRASERPLIVTNHYPTYGDLPYRFVPLGEAFLVQPGPSREVPAGLQRLDVDFAEGPEAKIRILGYRVHGEGVVHPGDEVTVDLVWQPLVRLERGYSFFVHLVGADGVPLGQEDSRHDAAMAYEPGEVLFDRYQFPVFLTAAPGTYRTIAGVYFTLEDGSWQRLSAQDGSDALSLAVVSIVPARLPPVTLHALYLPFAHGPTLLGVDYDDTLPEQRRVYLHWRAGARPAMAQLYAEGRVVAQGEVPAIGAAGGGERGYVTTALDLAPGTSNLRIALLSAGSEGTLPCRGAWGIARRAPGALPRSPSRQHYLPFGGKMALIGVRTSDTWAVGGQERVALRFLGLRPMVRDYVVSVGVRGETVTDAPSDWVPALGAMPTFKWIRGSQVTDVHLVRVLAGGGQAELTLGVYDAFTTRALPPLDERIARQGRAGVLLRQVEILSNKVDFFFDRFVV